MKGSDNKSFFFLLGEVFIDIFGLVRPLALIFSPKQRYDVVECFRYPEHGCRLSEKILQLFEAQILPQNHGFGTRVADEIKFRKFKNPIFFLLFLRYIWIDVSYDSDFFYSVKI